MAKVTFITGGQRSGKSRFAQKLAMEKSQRPVYLATSRAWDNDFKDRILRHQQDRGPHWQNIEEEKNISRLKFGSNDVVLLDCVTLWLTNIFHDAEFNTENALNEAKKEWNNFIKQDFHLIVVSNELGMSLHSETEAGRKFTDIQGWINQHIATAADEAFLMISGIPLKIK